MFCSQSPYKGWFLPKSFPVRAYDVERYEVNYECWWDLPDLPKLNFDNPGVVEHILEVGEWWVKEFDIDGWRLDYPSRSRMTSGRNTAAGSARSTRAR